MSLKRVAEWVALWGVCLSVAACGASSGHVRAQVTVTPAGSVGGQRVHFVVRGLPSHRAIALTVTSTDVKDVRWRSTTSYRANAAGVVDVDRATARSGAYRGVWGMGPVAMMQPVGSAPAGAYFWDNTKPQRFSVAIRSSGKTLARMSFTRRFARRPLLSRTETLRGAGLRGVFTYPAGARRHTAIVLLGGSEGGTPGPLESGVLAAEGYPVLALAYFKEPGLPQRLSRIPLEYFAHALRWLARRPQVNSRRIVVLGISRGSEAALLTGAYYPRLVDAVVAMVPSDVAVCSYPGCTGPAWTLHGRAIPYTRQFDDPAPTDDPAAVIPVWHIRGPVFLDCGTQDMVWTSCAYAKAIIAHLDAHHDPYAHVLYRYAGAGHGVGSFEPYEPIIRADEMLGDPQANQHARAQDWSRLQRFLATLSRSG